LKPVDVIGRLSRLAILLTCLKAAAGAAEPSPAVINLNAAINQGPVNQLIFGHNLEAGDSWHIFGDQHTPSNDGEGFWNAQQRDFVPEVMEIVDKIRVAALRYPGGSLANNFDWKKAVGPLDSRPDFQFGIDEYISLCRRLNAEPVMTVSDYHGTAKEAGELVEYLNSPATPAYPWALKRAAWGHPAPYHVRWFELGNETDQGNHQMQPFQKFTPAEYVDWAGEYAREMKAKDPTIKLGVVSATINAADAESPWNRLIFKNATSFADFVIVHIYLPTVSEGASEATLLAAAHASMASCHQLEIRLHQYHEAIRKGSGRDLPLAITEYNVEAVQDNSIPFRFSFVAGMEMGDFLRLCLEPNTGVAMANYWQLINGYWGIIRGTSVVAPYSIFELWAAHTGSNLIETEVASPHEDFPGGFGVSTAKGNVYRPNQALKDFALPPSFPPIASGDFSIASSGPRAFSVEFKGTQGATYPQLFILPLDPKNDGGKTYRISYEAKIEPFSPGKAVDYGEFGLGVVDARGWDATHSASAVLGVENADNWQSFSGSFVALPDITGVSIIGRWSTTRPFSGKLFVRNLHIGLDPETFPSYPTLTALGMKSGDGKSLQLIVFNKSLEQSIETSINIGGFPATHAAFSQLAAPPLYTGEVAPQIGAVISIQGNSLLHVFPPCSMTAITISK
jgi:alpha-N-arabinofuranosidase